MRRGGSVKRFDVFFDKHSEVNKPGAVRIHYVIAFETGVAQVSIGVDDVCVIIAEAKETSGTTQTWIQNWNYDRYGNRVGFSGNIAGQQIAVNNLNLPTIDSSTNRIAANQGYLFDKNGNVTNDPASGGRQFIFDGDNKQVEVKDANGATIGRYFYDGEGKRVKKVTDLETTIFVYSSGKLVAEYSTQTPPQNPTTNYTATDQVGSPRVITNALGQVVSRRDFMPFGEEIFADGVIRTTGNKYSLTGQDAVRQRFTGYQRDLETGLDFAEARYYNNSQGRFTAVDPLLASGKSANPQTFNRYDYCFNNPLINTDPTGLQAGGRVYVRQEGSWNHYILSKSPPSGFLPVTSTRKEYGRDGFIYEISRSGITGVGRWNQNVATPSQGIPTDNTTPGSDNTAALVNEIGRRGDASMKMIGMLSGASVIGGLSAVAAVGTATFGAIVVGEALLAEKSIRDQASSEHDTLIAGNIEADRKWAVSEAWKQEADLVSRTGQGSVPWTAAEKQELLETGKVSGYEGHHINSVNGSPEQARNPDNITFVRRNLHLELHEGNWRNPTEGPLIPRR